MNKKRAKIIILLLIVLLITVGIVVTVCVLGKEDKDIAKGNGTTENVAVATTADASPEKPATSTEKTTAASTEKPSEEEPEEPTTEGTTSAPAKPESTTEAPKPKPTTTEAPKPEPTTTEAPKPEPTPSASTTEEPTPSAPSAPTTEEPKHEHSWVWVETKAAGKVWVVDQAAWTETIEHPAKYDYVPAVACNYCNEIFTTADAYKAHKNSFKGIDSNHSCAGFRSSRLEVLVEDAWTETINHEEVGHWEETPAEGYYKCSCGATK